MKRDSHVIGGGHGSTNTTRHIPNLGNTMNKTGKVPQIRDKIMNEERPPIIQLKQGSKGHSDEQAPPLNLRGGPGIYEQRDVIFFGEKSGNNSGMLASGPNRSGGNVVSTTHVNNLGHKLVRYKKLSQKIR
jgi:hypothetical protein